MGNDDVIAIGGKIKLRKAHDKDHDGAESEEVEGTIVQLYWDTQGNLESIDVELDEPDENGIKLTLEIRVTGVSSYGVEDKKYPSSMDRM